MIFEYDLAHFPLNFEFLIWLVNAEMSRQRHRAPIPLRVRFTDAVSAEGELWLNNVFRPLLPMIGAVEDESKNSEVPLRFFLSREHLLGEIVDAARWGEYVPLLRASDSATEWVENCLRPWIDMPPIVITLRECELWPHRNSNLEAWKKFTLTLEDEGEQVIFVRDTIKADEPLEDFISLPRASRDLDIRMALYQSAKFCFFVANGPAGLAMFSRVPHTQFQTQYPGAQCPQWPWATKNQRIVCATDSYENLLAEWERVKNDLV